jgi:deoxyribonuclease-4
MTAMRYGLKLWSTNLDVAPEAARLVGEGTFDYIELMPVQGTDPAPFRDMGVPFVMHGPVERAGFNLGDVDARAHSLALLHDCLEWADALSADLIVVHPGFGSLDSAITALSGLDDRRVLIENMPGVGLSGQDMLGVNAIELRGLMDGRFGFCLDFNHAMKAATTLGYPHDSYLRSLAGLGPRLLHAADGRLSTGMDEHLAIGAGDYDFGLLAEVVRSTGCRIVTLETRRTDLGSFEEDLTSLKRLRMFLD